MTRSRHIPKDERLACAVGELWRPVVGWEGMYEVSNLGRVKSVARTVEYTGGAPRRLQGKILKQTPDTRGHGYLRVDLCRKGVRDPKPVQWLVAEAFIGPRPTGMHVCHNDGNPSNNSVDNLRYDTPVGNAADKVLHGTTNRGRYSLAKLSPDAVREIRALAASGTINKADLARRYGVVRRTIRKVASGQAWAWVS